MSLCRLITQKLWKVRFHAIDLWRLMSKRWSLLTESGSTYYLLPNHMKPSLSRLDLYFKIAKASRVKYALVYVCAHVTVLFPSWSDFFPSWSNFFLFVKSFWRNLPKKLIPPIKSQRHTFVLNFNQPRHTEKSWIIISKICFGFELP